jgi:Putative general bacterial porin
MFKKTALIAGIGLALSATAQADYRIEADTSVGRTNIEEGNNDVDVDVFNLGGTFYLESVDTSKGPLSEAAFLDHSSSITASYKYVDLDDLADDLDGDEYGIDGRYVLGLESLDLIFEGGWSRLTPDFSDIDVFTVGFGAYVTDTTTIVASYTTTDVDESDDLDPGDTDAYTLEVVHIAELSSGDLKLEGSYGLIDVDNADDIDAFSLGATWYLSDNLGLGVSYGRFDDYGYEVDAYGAMAEWFVTEQVGLSLSLEHSELDNTDVETDSVLLGARIRF